MKPLRFCGGVNIEPANLWTSKPPPVTAAVTPSPISVVSVCLNACLSGPLNPKIKRHAGKNE